MSTSLRRTFESTTLLAYKAAHREAVKRYKLRHKIGKAFVATRDMHLLAGRSAERLVWI